MLAAKAIDAIAQALRRQDGVRALFLSGSYGAGLEDEYSDLDMVIVTRDAADDTAAELWKAAILDVEPLVLWRDRQSKPRLINAITESWLRIDAVILKPQETATLTKDSLRPLFDRDGLYEGLRDSAAADPPRRPRIGDQFEEFIRILGLLPVVVGRREYLNGVTGVFHLRRLLIDLMIEETDAPHRGGALHLRRLLSADQTAALSSLPVPQPTRDAVIEAHLAYAGAYIPRARRLARTWGATWPDRFEAATWRRLRETLQIERPDLSE